MSREEFEQLPDEVKGEFLRNHQDLVQEVEKALAVLRRLDRDAQEELRALDREFALLPVGHLFDACCGKYQIPPNLMLDEEVVEAVAAGQFHVWAVSTVDEGIELLTGVTAGERQPNGSYPGATVHARVQGRLATMAARLARFGRDEARSRALAANGAGRRTD